MTCFDELFSFSLLLLREEEAVFGGGYERVSFSFERPLLVVEFDVAIVPVPGDVSIIVGSPGDDISLTYLLSNPTRTFCRSSSYLS